MHRQNTTDEYPSTVASRVLSNLTAMFSTSTDSEGSDSLHSSAGCEKSQAFPAMADSNPLSDEQAEIITHTFGQLKTNLALHGQTLFIKLFCEYPDYKDIWPQFRMVPDSSLMYSSELQNHVSNYMRGLSQIINALGDAAALAKVTKAVNIVHVRRAVSKSHIMNMLPQWLEVMKDAGVEVDAGVEGAWTTLYQMIGNQVEKLRRDPKWYSTSNSSSQGSRELE